MHRDVKKVIKDNIKDNSKIILIVENTDEQGNAEKTQFTKGFKVPEVVFLLEEFKMKVFDKYAKKEFNNE